MDPTCCTAEQMELIGVTAEQISKAFGIGFAAIVATWFLGAIIGLAIDVIKKV